VLVDAYLGESGRGKECGSDADAYRIAAGYQVSRGTHTADSRSINVSDAARGWITSCEAHRLEAATLASYRQHVTLHIAPYPGREKLSQLTAPLIREFEDRLRQNGRSPAMVRKS
jgi:integrase